MCRRAGITRREHGEKGKRHAAKKRADQLLKTPYGACWSVLRGLFLRFGDELLSRFFLGLFGADVAAVAAPVDTVASSFSGRVGSPWDSFS
jgi:hypothetical protein